VGKSRRRIGLVTSIARGKNRWRQTLLLAACLLPGVLAAGQTPGSADTKPQARPAFRRVAIDDQVKRLAKSLDLSETQQSEVKRILEYQQIQMRRIREDGSIPGDERIGRFRALQDSTVSRISAILNDEQKKKYNPLAVREVQKASPQPSVEDWMKAAAKQK
jgi:hypothetical protein